MVEILIYFCGVSCRVVADIKFSGLLVLLPMVYRKIGENK